MSVYKRLSQFHPVPVPVPSGELLLMEMSLQCAVDLARDRGLKQTEAQLKRSLMALRAEIEGLDGPGGTAFNARSPNRD